MDEFKKKIDLAPISDEVIKEKKFTLKDLWMVKDEGNSVFGPYDTQSLKQYSNRYEYLFESSKIYNLKEEKWFDIFSVAVFQRRKPKLVSSQNLIAEHEFFIQLNGLKQGPFTKEQVQDKLDTGEILPSIQISLDKGSSWIKLFEHHIFDRRSQKTNDSLPFRPEAKILEIIQEKKASIKSAEEKEDALVDLAFIGNHNGSDDITSELINKKFATPAVAQKNKSKKLEDVKRTSRFATSLIAGSLLAVVFFAGNFMFKSFDNVQLKQSESITEAKSINDSSRSLAKRTPASANTVKRKSVKRSAPRRYQRPKPVVSSNSKPTTKRAINTFEQEVEKLDINDPEVQEELTRQLAGDYDIDGEPMDNQENFDRDDSVEEEDIPEDEYGDEPEAVEHLYDEDSP